MKDKSTVQFGMELEHYIAQKFVDLGYKTPEEALVRVIKERPGI